MSCPSDQTPRKLLDLKLPPEKCALTILIQLPCHTRSVWPSTAGLHPIRRQDGPKLEAPPPCQNLEKLARMQVMRVLNARSGQRATTAAKIRNLQGRQHHTTFDSETLAHALMTHPELSGIYHRKLHTPPTPPPQTNRVWEIS